MLNNNTMSLNLEREEVGRISMALTRIIIDFEKRVNDESISKDSREIAKDSLEMWEDIRTKVKTQLKEFDKANR